MSSCIQIKKQIHSSLFELITYISIAPMFLDVGDAKFHLINSTSISFLGIFVSWNLKKYKSSNHSNSNPYRISMVGDNSKETFQKFSTSLECDHEPAGDLIFRDRTLAQKLFSLFSLYSLQATASQCIRHTRMPYTNISIAQDQTYHELLKAEYLVSQNFANCFIKKTTQVCSVLAVQNSFCVET